MTLIGLLYGHAMYEPPQDEFEDDHSCQLINLKEIVCLYLCQVSKEYCRSEIRGIIFQTRLGQEIQVNYVNEKDAKQELQSLKYIMGKLL